MSRIFRAPLAAAFVVALAGVASADVITDWNSVLLQAIRTDGTPPPRASRAMGIMSGAVFDAVNSIDRTHFSYRVDPGPQAPGTSREAAAAQAAYQVLKSIYPAQEPTFAAALSSSLSAIPDGPGKTAGINVGISVGDGTLALRVSDGSMSVVPYTPGTNPGDWRPTPPGFQPALLPQWPNVTPFTLNSGSQFRAGPPPALNTAAYTAAFNEVKAIGQNTSATRTADQTSIARFWADGGGTSTPPGHWNRIAQTVAASEGNSLSENARMFALLNLALADAAIVSWDMKYVYNYWRPVAGIREAGVGGAGDADGNPDTVADATWTPLITTPPFPAYTSGHSTFSSAAASILAQFFGTDMVSFTSSSEGFVEPDRSFTSFSQALDEAGLSRIYGGIHWSFDNDVGKATGEQVGEWAFGHFLLPIPGPSAGLALGLGALITTLRRRRA